MIILDTNVLSELARRRPDTAVLAWLDHQDATDVATTSVTLAELLYGVERLPRGRRRDRIAAVVDSLVSDDLGGRVHPFGTDSARHYAVIVAARERMGRPISALDAQIASICRSHEASIATRNVRDFSDTGVEIIDPWARATR
ncbi:MAG TPA: type II toxin-antitoxin system VapC family toxin [Candidatus Dormibacteraeota bacterium]|nr:type II toxin-antitoxin system VapC family toxin [Candidatus Dormibacteraeota bacterium]